MKVQDIRNHFVSRADWVDSEHTVDIVTRGNPEADIDRCLVSWMPSFAALRHMVENEVPLMICHEAIFWQHPDPIDNSGSSSFCKPLNVPANLPSDALEEKSQFIQKHDLTILRNHDCWDVWPDVGIPWAWASFLDLGTELKAVGSNGYQHRYDIEPVTLDKFAGQVAEKCAGLGEPLVQVMGNSSQQVSKIGIGTGCACDIPTFKEMGCDCSIVTDDGSVYWSNIQRADDSRHPVIRVNHGTSEEPGMVTMTEYINDNIEGVHAEHLPHGSSFRLVGANDG